MIILNAAVLLDGPILLSVDPLFPQQWQDAVLCNCFMNHFLKFAWGIFTLFARSTLSAAATATTLIHVKNVVKMTARLRMHQSYLTMMSERQDTKWG